LRYVELDEPEEHNQNADCHVEFVKGVALMDSLLIVRVAHHHVYGRAAEHQDAIKALQVSANFSLEKRSLQTLFELFFAGDATAAYDLRAVSSHGRVVFEMQ